MSNRFPHVDYSADPAWMQEESQMHASFPRHGGLLASMASPPTRQALRTHGAQRVGPVPLQSPLPQLGGGASSHQETRTMFLRLSAYMECSAAVPLAGLVHMLSCVPARPYATTRGLPTTGGGIAVSVNISCAGSAAPRSPRPATKRQVVAADAGYTRLRSGSRPCRSRKSSIQCRSQCACSSASGTSEYSMRSKSHAPRPDSASRCRMLPRPM